MSRYANLRRARMARHLSAEDGAYFKQTVFPLLAVMPPADHGPITVKAPALPEQTTTITALKLPPQKPTV